jgi:hypothetical protein
MVRLLLHHDRTRCDSIALRDVTDAQRHKVAAAELAVDPQVKQKKGGPKAAWESHARPGCYRVPGGDPALRVA